MSDLTRLLSDAVPPLHVRTVEPLGEGDFCVAWRVNDALVVRQARHPEADRALEREACLMPALAGRLPLPVPVPRVVGRGGSVGRMLAVHTLIEGVELTRTRWDALPEARRTSAARSGGRFLKALHDIEPAVARGCRLPVLDAEGRLRRLRGMLVEPPGRAWPAGLRGLLAEPLRQALLQAFVRYPRREGDPARGHGADRTGGPRGAALLHGDLSPGHVLLDPETGTLSGIIDWGDAMLGDPARDFIFLYEDWGRDFLDYALEGYGVAGDASFLRRILVLYLADQMEWTLGVAAGGRTGNVEQGLAGLERAVADLERIG